MARINSLGAYQGRRSITSGRGDPSIQTQMLVEEGREMHSTRDAQTFLKRLSKIRSPQEYVAVCRRIDPQLAKDQKDYCDGRLVAAAFNRVSPKNWLDGELADFLTVWQALSCRPSVVGSALNPRPEDVHRLWARTGKPSAETLQKLNLPTCASRFPEAVAKAAAIAHPQRRMMLLRHPNLVGIQASDQKSLLKSSQMVRWIVDRAVAARDSASADVPEDLLDCARSHCAVSWSNIMRELARPDVCLAYKPRGALWMERTGRIPQDKALRQIPKRMIACFDWKLFQRVRNAVVNETGCAESMRPEFLSHVLRLYALGHAGLPWFEYMTKKRGVSAHDSLHWLPDDPDPDFVSWLTHHKDTAIGTMMPIAATWNRLTPTQRKLPLNDLLSEARSVQYVGATSRLFALEAAKHGVDPEDYPQLESEWSEAVASERAGMNIPAVQAEAGRFRISKLAHNDPRGLFLGAYTECCQHPGGAGSTCAWHGTSNPDGAFYVVENNRGEIIAQAWTWRNENIVVFDSLETVTDTPEILELFTAVAQQLVGKNGVSEVRVGAYHRSGSASFVNVQPVTTPSGCYTDARAQYLIASKQMPQGHPQTVPLSGYTVTPCILGRCQRDLRGLGAWI